MALSDELARRKLGSEHLNCVRDADERRHNAAEKARAKWRFLWYGAHLFTVYFVVKLITPRLSGWTWSTVLPFLQAPTSASPLEFLFSHLLLLSFVPGFFAGLLSSRIMPKYAQLVWIVPTALLAYKLTTFHGPVWGLSGGQSWPALHHFFGGGFLIPEYRDWHEFWEFAGSNPDVSRGMAQLNFTAPFYAGLAYSLAAWLQQRTGLVRMVSARVKQWEDSKFGPQA
jgi:hypothetical protein